MGAEIVDVNVVIVSYRITSRFDAAEMLSESKRVSVRKARVVSVVREAKPLAP